MLCKLTRWLISRQVDLGKAVPRFALRHAARCGACRAYARFAASLPSRFAGERAAFLAAAPNFPLNEAKRAEDGAVRGKREILPRRLALRPFPAAAAAVLIVAGVLVLSQVVLREAGPSPQDEAAALAALKTVTAAPEEFQGMVAEAESPLAKERRILERSVASAVEYLQTRLNIKFERKHEPKTL